MDDKPEHLQASLAALQGVAAFVCQAGDDLPDRGEPFGLKRSLLRCFKNVMSWATLKIAGPSS